MWTAVGLQCVASVLGIALAWCFSGTQSAWFYFLGAAAATVPNALFALRLWLHRGKAAESYPVIFFLGEFAKIGLTIAALAWIVVQHQHMSERSVWISVMLGLVVALKAPLAMWWLDRNKNAF